MAVFVLGSDNKPLMPCTEKRARLLLTKRRAYVVRIKPFVIRMKDRSQDNCELQDLEVKIDPGSKMTGICLSRTTVDKVVNVLSLFELTHRGLWISLKLKKRAMYRRARRQRKTRYRQARFLNRTKPKGWLAPSLMHRIQTTMTWVKRLSRWSPVTILALERVKFDIQRMQNAEISGIEYQQGELFNYEVKEYLLEKFNRQCMYCDESETFLEIEHIVPRSKGGSNRLSNLGLACVQCNQLKSAMLIEEFLINAPLRLAKIKKQLKTPLRDAAMMNTTRNKLFSTLLATGLPVMTGSGAQTKMNRKQYHIPKTHALDAACVGDITGINNWNIPHQQIKCIGRGSHARTAPDKFGFPRLKYSKFKQAFGFQTGDLISTFFKERKSNSIVKVVGKIAIRQTGYFSILFKGNTKDVSWRNCKLLQRADGYSY